MGDAWRQHPQLQGKFHPDFPDDVQVIVHDGGPRMTDRSPELVWVRITGTAMPGYVGEVLNQPKALTTVKQGDRIRFLVPEGGEYPLLVREKYLQERPQWRVHPCGKCGLTELFDAPTDLTRKVFPDLPPGAVMDVFTSFCGACGGGQVVESKNRHPGDDVPPARKAWWQFWK